MIRTASFVAAAALTAGILSPASAGTSAVSADSAPAVSAPPAMVVSAAARVKGRQVRIKVKGQRYGKKAKVTLRRYRGKAKGVKKTVRVKKTKTVKRLKPGKYKVIAKRITSNGAISKAKKIKPKRVTFTKKRGATTWITYRQVKEPIPTPPPTVTPEPSLPSGAVAKLDIERYPFDSVGAYEFIPDATYRGLREYVADPDRVYYYKDSAQRLVIVTVGRQLVARTYDPVSWTLTETKKVSLSGWPSWGGFLAGEDGNLYVAVGRHNMAESSSAQVVAVRKYSQKWQLLGESTVPGAADRHGISNPFEGGVARMALCGGDIILHMARLMYKSDDGLNHQSSITLRFDASTMKRKDVQGPWVSHSFNQFVGCSGGNVVFVDHGDAHPRAITAAVGAGYPPDTYPKTLSMWPLPGGTGQWRTDTTVTGLGVGGGGFITVGTSVPHQHPVNGLTGSTSMPRNAYLLSSDMTLQSAKFEWLTTSTNSKVHSTQPRVTQIAPDRFAVLSSMYRYGNRGYRYLQMEYRLIDSSGNVLATKTWADRGFQSVSDPIYLGGKLIWAQRGQEYPSVYSTQPYLFALDLSNSSQPTLVRSQSVLNAAVGG